MENNLTPTNQTLLTAETTNINSDILKTLRQISLIFFFIIGLTHIVTGLLVSQNLLLPVSNLINKVLDIPFAIIAVIYGLSNQHIRADSPAKKSYFALMIVISLAVLGLLLYINLLIPDRIS